MLHNHSDIISTTQAKTLDRLIERYKKLGIPQIEGEITDDDHVYIAYGGKTVHLDFIPDDSRQWRLIVMAAFGFMITRLSVKQWERAVAEHNAKKQLS